MNRSVVAIPLLAAIGLGFPAVSSAQDPDPPVSQSPRRAASRPPERPGREAEPRRAEPRQAEPRQAQPRAAEPRAAEPRPPANAAAPSEEQRARGRAGRDSGRDAGRNAGRDNQRNGGRVAAGRPPDTSVRTQGYRPSYRPPSVTYRSNSYARPRYNPPVFYDRWARQTYRWSPLRYAPWGLMFGSVGFSNYGYYAYGNYGYPSYGYGPYSSYGYYGRSTSFDTGSVRLRIRPRDAEVWVDGYYAGRVDDFDGTFQSLRLEQGGHKIEIRMPGFQTLELDIHVQPNRTITIREDLIP